MKRIVIIMTALITLFLISCDYIIAPERGRENPNDPFAPVQSLSAYAISANQATISFTTASSWDEQNGEPSAFWIFCGKNAPPSSPEYAQENTDLYSEPDNGWYWAGDLNPSQSYTTNYTPASGSLDSTATYYASVFWTFEENLSEKDDSAEWFGPISDSMTFTTQTMTLNPTLDGFINDGYDPTGYTDTYLRIGLSSPYNYLSLLKFEPDTIPSNISTATLNLYFGYESGFSGGLTGTLTAALLKTDFDTSSNNYSTYSIDGAIDTDVSSATLGYSVSIPGDPIEIDVKSLVERWRSITDTRYGFRLMNGGNYVDVYSMDTSSEQYRPTLEITYYGEETE